jgi:NADPH:quinone reductase-like Zn-dependent oxidoreductase
MKAAVIHNFGETPRYEDFQDPIAEGNEKIVYIKASVLENFDKMVAAGTHYSSGQLMPAFPAIPGHAGIGMTEDGKLVGFGGMKPPYGSFAEKAVVSYTVPVPDGIDPAIAAALPSATLTSYLPLKYAAKLLPGESVLINGATGVSGKLAVQIAKMLGAGRIVATGRNEATLKMLAAFGADATINLKQPDEDLLNSFLNEAGAKGYNIVLDFLWGHPAEVLLKSFVPKKAGFAEKRIRYVHIGQKAGASISLSGEMLRTSGVELFGGGKISSEELQDGISLVWEWIKQNKLHIEIEKVPLSSIEEAWQREDLDGKRLVLIPSQ